MPDAYAPNLHLRYLKSSAVKRPLCSNKTGQKIERQESLFMAETLTWTDACKRACSFQRMEDRRIIYPIQWWSLDYSSMFRVGRPSIMSRQN